MLKIICISVAAPYAGTVKIVDCIYFMGISPSNIIRQINCWKWIMLHDSNENERDPEMIKPNMQQYLVLKY